MSYFDYSLCHRIYIINILLTKKCILTIQKHGYTVVPVHSEPLINIITLLEVTSSPWNDVTHYLLNRTHTNCEEHTQSGDWGHVVRMCVWPVATQNSGPASPKASFMLMYFWASTWMLMCTEPEPWPLTMARSGQGWRSPWMSVKENVIGQLMESIHFRALTLSYWEVRPSCQWTWVLCTHRGHFTTRGRASIKRHKQWLMIWQ